MNWLLVRCLKRWDALWGLAMVIGMGNGLFQLSGGLIERVAWLSPGAEVAGLGPVGARSLGLFAAALGLGMVVSGVLQDLWSAAAMRGTIGLRRRLRLELVVVFVAFAGLALALALRASEPVASALVWPVLPLGVTLGLLVFDPRWPAVMVPPVVVALIGSALGIEWLAGLSLLALGLGTLATTFVLALTLVRLTSLENQSAILVRQLEGSLSVTRHPLDILPFERRLRRGTLPNVRWTNGPVRTLEDHTRALEFERWGWAPRGWPFGRAGAAGFALVLLGLVTLGLAFLPRLFGSESTPTLIATLAELLGRPRPTATGLDRTWLVANAYPVILYTALLVVNDRMLPGFQQARLYPLSRTERALALWRGARDLWLGTLGRLAALSAALWLAATWAAGLGFEAAPPVFLVALVVAVAGLPLYQLTSSLRETRGTRHIAPWVAISIMIALLSVACGVIVGITVVVLELDTAAAWLSLAVLAASIVPGQLALRRHLIRRFRTLELA